MWRRAYLFLVLVRLYFALSPSYLHPDENFQGPEVIAGKFFPRCVPLIQSSADRKRIRVAQRNAVVHLPVSHVLSKLPDGPSLIIC
jgi:hypothetical protein